jgi:hypothetical protein
MRRSELPHERQKADLAEPLASKSWWRRTDKKFTDLAKNGVFQHNPPLAAVHSTSLSIPVVRMPSEIERMFWWLGRSSPSGGHKNIFSRLIHWGAAAPATIEAKQRDPQNNWSVVDPCVPMQDCAWW